MAYKRLRNDAKKSVIMGGFRHTVESPRYHYPEAELWFQSTSARAWDWMLFDWSRWFDLHDVEPNSYYPGIRLQRPDVLAWYHKQGSERPIYMLNQVKEIIGSRRYPIEMIEREFGEEATHYLGCQYDYMGAMAISEGFERIILYGAGQPYCDDRMGEAAMHWFKHHGTFLYWLRLARKRGIDIVFDMPETCMFTDEMIDNEEKWPPGRGPLPARYGYDMNVDSEFWLKWQKEFNQDHPWAENTEKSTAADPHGPVTVVQPPAEAIIPGKE